MKGGNVSQMNQLTKKVNPCEYRPGDCLSMAGPVCPVCPVALRTAAAAEKGCAHGQCHGGRRAPIQRPDDAARAAIQHVLRERIFFAPHFPTPRLAQRAHAQGLYSHGFTFFVS